MRPISHPFLLSFFPRMEQAEDLGSEHLLDHDMAVLDVHDLGSFGWSYKKKIHSWLGFHNFIWTFQICITVAWLLFLGFHILGVYRPPPSPLTSFSSDLEEICLSKSHPSPDCDIRNGNLSLNCSFPVSGMRVQSLLVHSLYHTELSPILEMVVIAIIIANINWASSI